MRYATSLISDKLQTRVEIKSVSLSVFGGVILNGIYVEDFKRDTLIYADRLTASVNSLPLRSNELKLSKIKLTKGKFYLRDSVELNLTTLIRKISAKDTTEVKEPNPLEIKLSGIELDDFDFIFRKYDSLDTLPHPEKCIDFKDIEVSRLKLKADEFNILNDTIFFSVKELSLLEKSGYRINKLSSRAYIVPGKEVHLDDVDLEDDYSKIRLRHYSMSYNGGEEFSDFVNKVNLQAYILKSQLSVRSLGYFAKVLQDIPLDATINGIVTGPIANLKSNNLRIESGGNTLIEGRFSVMGLPEIKETILFADFRNLRTSPDDLCYILNKSLNLNIDGLLSFLTNVNQINFNGTFNGLYDDFVANGKLATNLGTLKMDLLFSTAENKEIDFSGQVATSSFELGQLLKTQILGHTIFNLHTEGKIIGGDLDVFGEGQIAELVFNNYNYKDIKLSGKFLNNIFDGNVEVKDENADVSFVGRIDLKGDDFYRPIPAFDFNANIEYLNLMELKLNKRDSVSELRGKIAANFKGHNLNDFEGDLKLTGFMYRDTAGVIPIGDVILTSQVISEKNHLYLFSDFAEAKYIGRYRFGNFIEELKLFVYNYIPNLNLAAVDKPVVSIFDHELEPYEIELKTKKLAEVARIILPSFYIAENSTASLKIDEKHNLKLDFTSPYIRLQDHKLENISITADNSRDTMFVNGWINRYSLGSVGIENVDLKNTISKNYITTNLDYKSNDTLRTDAAHIELRTGILLDKTKKYNQVSFNLDPSNIILNGSQWELGEASALIDTGRIKIDHFMLYRNNQQLRVNGVLSHNTDDTLSIRLFNYEMESFNYFTEKRGYKLGGMLSGYAEITGIYNTPLIMVNLNAKDISINNDTIGNSTIATSWDSDYERLNVIARIFTDESINTSINGFLSPKDNRISFDADLRGFNLVHLEPLLTGIVSDIKGTTSGKLALKGKLQSPELTGNLKIDKTSMKVDYLGVYYELDANVDVEKSSISIKDGVISDKHSNKGRLSVTLNHNAFKDITFKSLASVNNMLCLDTKETDNAMFYGTSYATGGIEINGTPKEMHFIITAQAERGSKLFIPLPKTTEVKETSLLKFKSVETEQNEDDLAQFINRINKTLPTKTQIDFSLDLTVTPETEIQLLIDPFAGDILKAQGYGNLKMDINPAIDEFKMVGDYKIEKGEYNFVLPNFDFVTRKFSIDQGSRIVFNGDILGAELDIIASHKARASLATLFQEETTQGVRRYDVIAQIFITGKMLHPNLRFNVDFPNLDPENRARVMSVMNTEEKMTTQFLSLLVMGAFIPEQQYGNANYGTTTVMNNATELLSAQLGNLISMLKLPIPLDVSVDLDVTSSQHNSVEVGVQTQLFNRVIINSTVGNNTRTNRDFVGDVDIYYLLGKEGKFRFKVFTRSSDYFTDDLETNMQGVGASYQTDFDNFKELFRRKKKEKKYSLTPDINRKEDEEDAESESPR